MYGFGGHRFEGGESPMAMMGMAMAARHAMAMEGYGGPPPYAAPPMAMSQFPNVQMAGWEHGVGAGYGRPMYGPQLMQAAYQGFHGHRHHWHHPPEPPPWAQPNRWQPQQTQYPYGQPYQAWQNGQQYAPVPQPYQPWQNGQPYQPWQNVSYGPQQQLGRPYPPTYGYQGNQGYGYGYGNEPNYGYRPQQRYGYGQEWSHHHGWHHGRGYSPGDEASAAQMMNILMQECHMTRAGAAAVTSNMHHENGLRTDINSGGVGLIQWIGARAYHERQFAAAYGLSPTSLQAQLGFMMHELNTEYPWLLRELQTTNNAGQAAMDFQRIYERPRYVSPQRGYTAQVYMAMGGGSGGTYYG